MEKQKLKQKLLEKGLIKKGDFVMKSGESSEFYFDFRDLISHPKLLNDIADKMVQIIPEDTQILIALPYAALPLATLVSVKSNIPMVFARKEKKEYGTGRLIEGKFKKGQKAVIIDDVITSGLSKKEALSLYAGEGLSITEILVIVDRRAVPNESFENIRIKALFNLSDFDISSLK